MAPTVDDVLSEFLREQDRRLSHGTRTFEDYARTLSLLRAHLNAEVSDFTATHGPAVLARHLRYFTCWHLPESAGLTAAQARHAQTAVRGLTRWLVDHGYLVECEPEPPEVSGDASAEELEPARRRGVGEWVCAWWDSARSEYRAGAER